MLYCIGYIRAQQHIIDHVGVAAADDIEFVDFPHYDMSVFALCEMRGYMLITPANWQDIHPTLSVKPLDENFTIPYGVEYASNLTGQAKRFLEIIKHRH